MFSKNYKFLKPYVVSNRFEGGSGKDKIILDWNEATRLFSNSLQNEIKKISSDMALNYYGDISCKNLINDLSEFLEISKENISVFNGSDSAINNIFNCIIDPKDIVLKIEPEYSQVDTFIVMNGARIVNYKDENIFNYNHEEVEKCIQEVNPKAFYFSNPNNPSGRLIKKNYIENMLQNNKKTWFLIDEAYIEFSHSSCLDLIEEHQNLVIFRTFSKAFGLAGIRIGYVLSNKKNINEFNKVRNGKEVNPLGQAIASAALNHKNEFFQYIEEINLLRDTCCFQLNKIKNVKTINTNSNFFLIQSQQNQSMVNYLKKNNIFIRNRDGMHGMNNTSRVTIGTKSEMKNLISLIKKFFCNL